MIKLEDIKFESRRVGSTEDYPEGKTGCEMVGVFESLEDNQEVVYAEHDFENETLTEAFKQRALENMNKAWANYENKFTTKLRRWWRKWVLIPQNRVIR